VPRQGVVLDLLLASKGMSGFAYSYAVAGYVLSLGRERSLVGRPGLDLGERRPSWPAPLGGWSEAASGHWPDPPRRRARRARATRDHRI